MVVKENMNDFLNRIPCIPQEIIKKFSKSALEFAAISAKQYPPQMQDLTIQNTVTSFIGTTVAMMTLDKMYEKGIFKPLTENEKITADLFMFSDVLPK
jgi:hypothetical protein